MKKTQRKDLYRTVRRQWVSFLSIIIIAMIGVTTFCGIEYSAYALRKNGSDLYNELNFRDIEVISTLLFTEKDLETIRGVEGVTDVEAVRSIDAEAIFGDTKEDVTVASLTTRINRVKIVSGRMPTAISECAIEEYLADEMHLRVGDRIGLLAADPSMDYLGENTFTIVGIVHHPDHTNTIVQESPYVLVPYDAFDADRLNGCFMKAEITVEKAENVNRFSDGYRNTVSEVCNHIESLSVSRTVKRDAEVRDSAQTQIGSAKEQLESGFAQLEEAKATVRGTLQSLVEAVFKQNEEKQLIRWATVQTANVDNPNETAKYLWITQNIRVDLSRSPREIFTAILSSESLSDKFLASIYEYVEEEDAPRVAGGTEYDIEKIRAVLVERATAYAEDYQALSDGCNAWDEGHAAYLAGLDAYREKMASLHPCRWIILDANGNASFAQLIVGSGNFSNLKTSFSMMFVFVGALVIFATVGKIVDEQRNLIGTMKALGFFNREIFAKYLSLGVFATAIGMVLGILVARFSVEPFLLNGIVEYYMFDLSKPHIHILPTVIVLVFGVLLATVAVWFACNRLLHESAVRLMQPKAPGVKKASVRKSHRKRSLYSHLILLNMRTDLKRVIVTIVSVAGCCALVIIGITLRDAILNSIDIQYNEIVDYDICIQYHPESAKENGKEFEQILDEKNAEFTQIYSANATYRVTDLQIAELYCGDLGEIGKYYHLKDWKTGKPIAPTDRGVLIQRRIAETCGLDVGSEFEIAIGGTKAATVRVAGIFENYIGRIMVMSSSYYEKIYEEAFVPNAFMVRLGDSVSIEELSAQLLNVDGYETIIHSDVNRSIIETSTSMVHSVVLMFIGIAAIMAGVVQMNLTNMYVLQKKRELTIMRINGFTTKEVIGYLLRETVVTTILGILLGIAAGTGVAYNIVRTMEQSFLQFDRSVNITAWLCGAGLTVVFTVIVNAIALRNVKNLKLTDVA